MGIITRDEHMPACDDINTHMYTFWIFICTKKEKKNYEYMKSMNHGRQSNPRRIVSPTEVTLLL